MVSNVVVTVLDWHLQILDETLGPGKGGCEGVTYNPWSTVLMMKTALFHDFVETLSPKKKTNPTPQILSTHPLALCTVYVSRLSR